MSERPESAPEQQNQPLSLSTQPLPAAQNSPAPQGVPPAQNQYYQQNYQGKPYNKHSTAPSSAGAQSLQHAGGQRQNYSGSQGKPHYNKRSSYNQKQAGHSNQYGGYAYPNMGYPGYYYSYGYTQPMVPGMGAVPAYSPQLPQLVHSPLQQYPGVTSPGSTKVKITDREGKLVELDDKARHVLASSSPAPTATSASAESSPSPSPASTASVPAAAAASPAKNSVAEEFRRKIAEKARLAQAKKDAEKAASAGSEAPKTETKVETKVEPKTEPKVEPKVETKPVEPKTETKPAEAKPVEKVEVKEEPKEVKVEAPAETKPVEPVEPVETKSAEPVEPVKPVEEVKVEEPAAKEPVETVSEPVSQPVSAEASESKSEDDLADTTADTSVADDSIIAEEENDEDEDEEDQEEAAVFDLSLFFSKLSTAHPIDDPFSFNYPYPLTGVDSRWKQGKKKYRYDPQFLLQFKDFVQYPIDDAWKEKLEGLGIVPNKRPGSGPQRMNSNKFGGQMQGRFNGSMSGRQGQFEGRQNSRSGSKRRGGSNAGGPRDRSLRNRGQSKRGKERDDEPPKPAEDVAPLVPTANRWVPRSRAKPEEVKTAPDGSVILSTEDIERKVKSALNKLTLEMFEPITEDLLNIAKQSRWEDDAKTVKQVISLTFAKACDEPYWSSVYAQFCAKMLKLIPDEVKDVSILTKNGEPATGGDLARRILLATCQSEYEKGWTDKLPTNEDGSPLEPEMMSDEYYAMAAAKRRGLGLVKFIGNLYILNMLNDQVILACLRDQSKNVVDPSEDSLENLAQLIKTVGPRFETSERNKAALNMIYDNIQQILENCKLSSRIKFMLMDLQDLRKSNWKGAKQESGPKTIKEIHNEAELKRIEDSRAQAEKRRQNKGSYNSGGYGGGDSRSNSTRGGSSWGNKKDSRGPQKDSRGFTAVPRSQSNRPSDSSMSASTMSPRENSKRTDSMASNIFAALDGDNDDEESENAGH